MDISNMDSSIIRTVDILIRMAVHLLNYSAYYRLFMCCHSRQRLNSYWTAPLLLNCHGACLYVGLRDWSSSEVMKPYVQ
jgi:hypothetical protein